MSEVNSSLLVSTQSETSETPAQGVWFLSGQIDESEPTRQYEIHSFPFSIGRRKDASMCLPLGCISKNHVEITAGPGDTLILREMGSTNGTFVNGEKLEGETTLHENDLIHLATLVFRVGHRCEGNTVFNTVHEDACDKALAMIQFERLISDGGLYPHFQPIVTLQNQERIGYEVLGRSRLFGLQSPYEMFAAASQLNMESQLSEAFRLRGVEIGTAFGPGTNLFVNTHPNELDRPELYQSLKDLRDVAPDQMITLEIHEAASTNLSMMSELRSVLSDLEMKLAFDDFGVGRARLVELGEVRPDYLKFDMKLTKNIENAPASRQELVALFANLVNSLGIHTLAEGVETRECHETLVEMGFELGQGFYYGRPSPISKFVSDKNEEKNDTRSTEGADTGIDTDLDGEQK